MRVAIFGIGNVLAHDDAVGPSVARLIDAEWLLPAGVVVEDLGTPALELQTHMAGYDEVIIIDAVAADAPPGTLRLYDREAILRHPPGLRITPHDPSLKETLQMLDFLGEGPGGITLVGVVAGITDMGVGLSPEVRAALPAAVDAVMAELARLGVSGARRATPRAADLWWAA